MNIKEMAELATTIIGESIGPIPVDVRTIRYYETYGVMEKPGKKGRENDYDVEHLKRLLAIKGQQAKGATLGMIKHLLDVTKIDVDAMLRNSGIDPVIVEAFVAKEIKPRETEGKEEEMKAETKDVKKVALENPKEEDKSLSVTVTNHVAHETIKDRLFVGSSFAFINGPADEVSRSIYAKLHGVLKKPKAMERAVIHVDEEVELIGCTVKGRGRLKDQICVLVPDKDGYREGDDVARIFVFDPESKDQEIPVTIFLSGAPLDILKVRLDDNGCGLARFPTLVSGRYEASIPHGAKCSFEASRYELDPLSVSVTACRKSPEGIEVDLSAQRYGKPMTGKAIVRLADDGSVIAEKEVEFSNGVAKTKWADLGQGNASIQLMPSDDRTLVASSPIQGSRKEEREDTVVSRMGRVLSASLLPSEGSERCRGVHVSEDGVTNSPVSLDSVFCRGSATLRFSADATDVMVAVSDPSSGEVEVFSLGDVRKGGERKIKVKPAFSLLSVGAFVDGTPWEANSVVIRVSEADCEVEVPKSLSPSEELEIKVSSKKPCSVLLKVSDNRVRAMYEPMVAIASKAKSWMSKEMLGMLTGNAWKPVVQRILFAKGVRGMTGPTGPSGSFGWSSDDGFERDVKSRARVVSRRGASLHGDGLLAGLPDLLSNSLSYDVNSMVSRDSSVQCYYNAPESSTKPYSPLSVPQAWGLAEASSEDAMVELPLVLLEEEARRSDVDVVFCELVRVPKSGRTIRIRLPDRIATYDVKAFFVNGSDWGEKEEKVVVSKPMYIEPMIPSVATEEDSCRAVVVNAKDDCELSVRIDGKDVKFERSSKGQNTFLKWKAIPGVHEVSASMPLSEAAKMAGYRPSRRMSDKVSRIVEPPGEEVVLCQEALVLPKGKKYELEPDAISVAVLPGIQEELKTVVHVAVDFQHSCCEQTASRIVAACVAMSVGNDGDKEQACKAIVNGEARLRSMYDRGSHAFSYYPGASVNEWASSAAANRLARIEAKDAPKDVSDALLKVREMASDVLRHSKVSLSPMEAIHAEGKHSAVSVADAKAAATAVSGGSSMAIAEAAYAAACLLKSGRLDAGVEVANVVAKAMAPAMGGFHGTNDLLAYLVMVLALSEAGVVPSSGGKVVVDGKVMGVNDATKKSDASRIEARDNAVAIRINRIKKVRLDEENPAVPIEVKLVGGKTKAVKAGGACRLVVRNSGGYKAGDVVMVRLPQCLSRLVGGGKQKKFQVDFEGKDEVSIDLVAHEPARQKMAVVVRNMYDSSRIGSAGLIDVTVA